MPAPPLSHTFDSDQADTTVITTGNSVTGGNAFSAITGSPTYSATNARSGTLAMGIDTTAAVENHADWTGLGSITTSVWFRAYCYFTANPTAQSVRLIGARTSAAANSGFVVLETAGTLRGMNAAQTGIGSSSAAISLNQWIRVEWRIVSSTTVGELEVWLYNNPEDPIESFTSHLTNTAAVLGANTDGVRYGSATATGPASYIFWMDDIAVSSTSQIGPFRALNVPTEFPPRHFGPF